MGRPAHPYTALLIASARGEIRAAVDGPGGSNSGGCPFAERCDRAQQNCSSSFPEMAELEEGRHLVRCHFPMT